MAAWVVPAIQAAAGLAGLFGQRKSQGQKDAESILATQKSLYDQAAAAARAYDPAREDQAAIDYAAQNAQRSMADSLKKLNMEFRNGGGSAGQDTLFGFQAQGMTNRAYDPLRAMAAELASTRTGRKVAALSSAAGGGGNLVGQYLQAGQAERDGSAAGPSMGLLAGALESLMKGKTSRAMASSPSPGEAPGWLEGGSPDRIAARWQLGPDAGQAYKDATWTAPERPGLTKWPGWRQ